MNLNLCQSSISEGIEDELVRNAVSRLRPAGPPPTQTTS